MTDIQLDNGRARRIILHWTAGTNEVSAIDREHYHWIIDGAGKIIPGRYSIADNDNTSDGRYAAHTLNCNTRSVGLAVAGMAGGRNTQYPISTLQIQQLCQLAAQICQHYQIDISEQTVLMHSEVQTALGIPQRGKIDLDWLTCYPELKNRAEVGRYLRDQIAANLTENPPTALLLYRQVKSPAILQDGTTLLPLRETCQLRQWGLTLLPERQARLTIDSDAYLLEYAIIDTIGYISARKLADALGKKIQWDAEKRIAKID